jgi:hypothetical protein
MQKRDQISFSTISDDKKIGDDESCKKRLQSGPIDDHADNLQHDACNFDNDWKDCSSRISRTIDLEIPTTNLARGERLERVVQVGAFPVAGIDGGMNIWEEPSLPEVSVPLSHTTHDLTSLTITSARLVEDDIPPAVTLVNAIPLEGLRPESSMKAMLRNRYCWLASIVSLFISTGVIIAMTVTVRNLSKEAMPNSKAISVLEKLKPLLTNTTILELDKFDSIPSLSLRWLLEESDFDAYSFDRQVQRFAMAIFFFSTNGRLWTQSKDWLTNLDECTWFQNITEDLCVHGTLRILSLRENNLIGSIPNEISLLSSLNMLDVSSNFLYGSIPPAINTLSTLSILDLHENYLDGSFPKEFFSDLKMLMAIDASYCWLTGELPSTIGQLTSLEKVNLMNNSLSGTIPTEIGVLKRIKQLLISFNYISGEIPSEIGQCANLTTLSLENNALSGLIPSEIYLLTKLRTLGIQDNFLDGTIPENLCSSLIDSVVDCNITCWCCDFSNPLDILNGTC